MKNALFIFALTGTLVGRAVTTGVVPADGVYRFTFGTDSVAEGFAVSASAVYDATKAYANTAGATLGLGMQRPTVAHVMLAAGSILAVDALRAGEVRNPLLRNDGD